jgi:hypothetical protein
MIFVVQDLDTEVGPWLVEGSSPLTELLSRSLQGHVSGPGKGLDSDRLTDRLLISRDIAGSGHRMAASARTDWVERCMTQVRSVFIAAAASVRSQPFDLLTSPAVNQSNREADGRPGRGLGL